MPEISVKDQIKKLVELQKLDQEIYNLNTDLKEKPVLVERLKEEFENSKAHLHELEENSKSIQVARKDQELDLTSKEEDITKANTVLSQIKTNKEYTAKISEIENIKADKSVIEEKILLSYDESDKVNAQIQEEKAKVSEREKEYLAKKKEVEDDIKIIQDRIKVLEGQRKQLTPEVDPNILGRYEKILQHKSGMAIVSVHGNSCGGCYMNVTPQMINQIKMHADVVACEMCTRILYIEDDL